MMSQLSDDGRSPDQLHLSAKQQAELLRLARAALIDHYQKEQVRQPASFSAPLEQVAGVFVTLRIRTEDGLKLRGCIGQVEPDKPLYKSVPEMTIKSASSDPRFPSVTVEELDDLHISISILSPLERIPTPESFEIGIHGLLIEGYGRRGLLLPEVPINHGWNKQEFLQALCRKAGLPPDYWRSSNAKIFSFTSVEFEE